MKKIISLLLCIEGLSIAFADFPPPRVENTIKTSEAELFYETLGQGNPVIVLHGGPGLSYEYLMPQMGKLAENNLVIFYDQRGSGRSQGGDSTANITVDMFVKDVDAVRKHFGFKKVSILGHSWGGFLAMQYAIAHPESIDKLILLNSLPATSEDTKLFLQEWSKRMAPFMEDLEKIKASIEFIAGDPATMETYLKMIFRTYCAVDQKVDDLNLQMSSQEGKNWVKTSDAFGGTLFTQPFDLTETLKKLPCKTLIVHGDKDPIPVLTAKHLHDNIPHSQFVVIQNCGHFPYVEQPEHLFSILDAFLLETKDAK